jgi:hypothetical protein
MTTIRSRMTPGPKPGRGKKKPAPAVVRSALSDPRVIDQIIAMAEKAWREVEEFGIVIESQRGTPVANPSYRAWLQCIALLQQAKIETNFKLPPRVLSVEEEVARIQADLATLNT